MPVSTKHVKKATGFPSIGNIRKGAKKVDPRKPGEDLKYFRVEFDAVEADAERVFKEVYKDSDGKPSVMNIMLPFNEIDRVWEVWLEAYTGGQMVARAGALPTQDDQDYFYFWRNPETGDYYVRNNVSTPEAVKAGVATQVGVPVPYSDGVPVGHYISAKQKRVPIYCNLIGRFKVMLPELRRACYLTMHTTSLWDVQNISDQLSGIHKLAGGNLAGIPLLLKRKPSMVSTPGEDGKRVRREKWLVAIEVHPDWMERMINAQSRMALPETLFRGLLTDGKVEVLSEQTRGVNAPETDDEVVEGEPVEHWEGFYNQTEDDEVVEGEVVDAPPKPVVPSSERPYAPETLRQKLIAEMSKAGKVKAADFHKTQLKDALDLVFDKDAKEMDSVVAEKIATVLMFLVGLRNLSKLTDVQVMVLLNRWLAPKFASGGMQLAPDVYTEAEQAYQYAKANEVKG